MLVSYIRYIFFRFFFNFELYKTLYFQNQCQTFNNIEIHLRTLIYIIIFLGIFFQIKFTTTLIDEPKFLEWNYLFSIENISVMFMEKLLLYQVLYPVYSLHFILFNFSIIISIFTILFLVILETYKFKVFFFVNYIFYFSNDFSKFNNGKIFTILFDNFSIFSNFLF